MNILIKIILVLFAIALASCCCHAGPGPYSTIIYSNSLTGLFVNSGDEVRFTFTGTNDTTWDLATAVAVDVDEPTNLATFASPPGASWTITGSLIAAGTNLQVSIQYSDATNSASSSFVLTNFNWYTNTLWLSWYAPYDPVSPSYLTGATLNGPNIPLWWPYTAGLALQAFNSTVVTNGSTNASLAGVFAGDGTGLLITGTNLVAGTVNSNSLDADTLAWIASLEVVPGGAMNFDAGLITSDGSGNISANSLNNTNGPVGINNLGDTGGETDPSQILMGQFSGGSPCWIVMQGQGKMSFYSGSGSFIHENHGIHLVCATGQENTHPNWSDGPMVVGLDYAADLPSTYFPDNSFSVEGYIGAGTYSPAYPLDVNGDINFTGNLRFNGSAVIQSDSGGNGGTTLMLNASDTGTPMYLHVDSTGTATWTSSP